MRRGRPEAPVGSLVPGQLQAYKYHGANFEAQEKGKWPGVWDIFGLEYMARVRSAPPASEEARPGASGRVFGALFAPTWQ